MCETLFICVLLYGLNHLILKTLVRDRFYYEFVLQLRKQRLHEVQLFTKITELSVSRTMLLTMTLNQARPLQDRAARQKTECPIKFECVFTIFYLLNLAAPLEGQLFGFMCPYSFGKR